MRRSRFRIPGSDIGQDILEDEQCRDDIHQNGHFLGLAAGQLDDSVADEAEADTIGDRKSVV